MNDRLRNNITTLGFWLEEVWSLVDSVYDEDYHVEAIQLLTVAVSYWELLTDFNTTLDQGSIDFCFMVILNIFSILRFQIRSLLMDETNTFDKNSKKLMITILQDARRTMVEDFNDIVKEYGLTELY